jgi:hypothetical protein
MISTAIRSDGQDTESHVLKFDIRLDGPGSTPLKRIQRGDLATGLQAT